MYLIFLFSLLFIFTPSSFADEDNCYPAGTPCPEHYKSCLRVSLRYHNATGSAENNTLDVHEIITIRPRFLPTIQRIFKKSLQHGAPVDCLFDSDLLDRRTNLTGLSIELNSQSAPSHKNCQMDLARHKVIDNHSYQIDITQQPDKSILCNGG